MNAVKKELHKCGVEGCDYEHELKSSVGVHRRFKHGIEGPQSHYTPKKAPKQLSVAPKPVKEKGQNLQHVIPETILAHTIGRIEEILLHTALQHDLPPKLFAQRFVEYLSNAQGR